MKRIAIVLMVLAVIVLTCGCTNNAPDPAYHDETFIVKNNVPAPWGATCSCNILASNGNSYSVAGLDNCVKLVSSANVTAHIHTPSIYPGGGEQNACAITAVKYNG